MSSVGRPEPPPPPAGDPIERVLRAAGSRPAPDEATAREVEAVVRARWRELTRHRAAPSRWSRPWLPAAAALLVALTGVVAWRLHVRQSVPPIEPQEAPVATVELAAGASTLRPPGGGPAAAVVPGGAIGVGWLIETDGAARLTLRLAGGAQLRLDGGALARWQSAGEVGLQRGGLYVDSGEGGAVALAVRTPHGLARELGTRFEVRCDDRRTLVRVRSGGVALTAGGAQRVAGPGTEVSWSADRGFHRRSIPIHGPGWSWVLAAAPTFPLEGSTLDAFLAWVAAENGWEVRFADPEHRRTLGSATLHGSLAGVRPDEAPAVVLPALGLRARVEDGVLVVVAGR